LSGGGPFIRFSHVHVRYFDREVLSDVTFTVEKPSFLAVVGPNGAGKTTLLRTMLGVVRPFKGEVVVMGVNPLADAVGVRRRVGYVPQKERVDETLPMLVKDVVLMGRAVRKPAWEPLGEEDYEAAHRALEAVGLDGYWDRPFSHLSGGQQQRVLIARALASSPSMLLLDEPLSGVDMESQRIIVGLLSRLAGEGVGIVTVTHDLNPYLEHLDYVLLLNRRVVAFGRVGEILDTRLLAETYQRETHILQLGPRCYILCGDAHA